MRSRALTYGMTLIEVLVALALLSMLSLGMLSTFHVAQRSYTRSLQAAKDVDEILAAQRFLRRVIEGATPIPTAVALPIQYRLVGGEDQLTLLAPAPSTPALSAPYHYRIGLQPRGNSSDVVVFISHGDSDPVSGLNASDAEEVLLRNIQSAQWSYASRVQADGQEVLQWNSSWAGHAKPPALVKLDVRFAASDRRTWPLLIVDPRATDDAQCEFDIVGQTCRSHGE